MRRSAVRRLREFMSEERKDEDQEDCGHGGKTPPHKNPSAFSFRDEILQDKLDSLFKTTSFCRNPFSFPSAACALPAHYRSRVVTEACAGLAKDIRSGGATARM